MKCIECPYHSIVLGQYWCDAKTPPRRLDYCDIDIDIEADCSKYEKKRLKEQINDR